MKIDFIYTIVATAVSALIAWGLYEMTDYGNLKIYVAIVSFISLSFAGVCSLGLRIGEDRSLTVIRFTSGAFFFVSLLMNFIFTFFDFSIPFYIILNAILLLTMLVIIRSVAKSGM